MRISNYSLAKLKTILKEQQSIDSDDEHAQLIGRAILRLAGIKLYQQFEKEITHEISQQNN
jgi:hypothetical protein